ncbi:MAG: ABC transporter permease, partial [Bilophila sp.]
PLLVLYSDFMGILGGFIVGVGILGLDPMEYYTFTQKGFGLNNLWVGLAHGVVFGLVIAITGCYQGLRCGRSAEAVGIATTSAVVFSIVGIVLSTAVLTILCNILSV